ncbi:ABC transporter substrate-binding protein [Leisingera daeponensis]|uniref:ABC transporter substrate-binding protein n=1 Tax=Leisingera daeponensis TaxID=405746 RepID=UPI001C984DEE|nr:ABC transporter substrate-binding protein [Leisingera daeponensis]MBY6058590.1 ABC transporter substrate-binding protein [Leisingera daeponensis]
MLRGTGALLGGTLAGGLMPAWAQELTNVTVRLAFSYNGHRSPYLLGVDKGFYQEEGLNVEVLEGKGVTSSMQLVASGDDTFNIVDPPSLMLGVAQGMPLRQVAQLYQISPNALISWKEHEIKSPADLVGRTVTSLQGDTTTTMLYALLAKNGINRNDLNIVAADGGTRNQTFLGKRADAVTGFYNDSYLGFQDATDDNVDYFLYSSFGVDTMGDGIAAHTDTIESSPEVVAGFVRATLRAYEYALQHPEEAIASLISRASSRKAEVEILKLQATASLLQDADGEGARIGESSKTRWEEAQALMNEFGGLKQTVNDVSAFYTNDFLPEA